MLYFQRLKKYVFYFCGCCFQCEDFVFEKKQMDEVFRGYCVVEWFSGEILLVVVVFIVIELC